MHKNYLNYLKAVCLMVTLPFGLKGQWVETKSPGTASVSVLQTVGGRVEAATNGGPKYSDDAGLTWQKRPNDPGSVIRSNRGIYYTYWSANVSFYKSTDRGNTWDFLAENLGFLGQGITDFTVVGDTVFATNSYKVWRNIPGSNTWDVVYETLMFGDLRLTPTSKYLWIAKKQLLRSSNGGANWQDMTPAGVVFRSVVVNGDTILASAQSTNGLYFSADNGQTWTIRGNVPSGTLFYAEGIGAIVSGNQVFVSWDAGFAWKKVYDYPYPPTTITFSNGTILMGLPNGLLRSIDQGDHWLYSHANLNQNTGFPFARFWPVGDWVLASPQNQFSFDKGQHWFSPFFPGGINDIAQHSDSLYLLSSYYKLLHRSNANLVEWDTVDLHFISGTIEFLEAGDSGLYLVDLTAGIRSIHLSTDNGSNWVKQGEIPFLMIDFDAQAGVLYGLDTNGDVYVSLNQGVSWVLRNNGLDYPINDMFVAGNYAYAYRYNSIQGVFYVSTDYGENWTQIPATIDRSVSYTAKDNLVFVGDVFGRVYWIDGPNGEWQSITDNLPSNNGENAIGFQGNTLMFMDNPQNRVYSRELTDLGKSTATGKIFKDDNLNGVQETTEPGLANFPVASTLAGGLSFSGINGLYHVTVGSLPDALSVTTPGPYSTVQPASHLVATTVDTQYHFAISTQPGTKDLQVDLGLNGALLSGKTSEYVLTVQNVGSDSIFFAPHLVLPPLLTLVSTVPQQHALSGDTIVWPSTHLAPQSLKRFRAKIQTPANIMAGATVHSEASAPLATDLVPENNNSSRIDTVFTAFDPNTKESSPAKLTPALVAAQHPIEYTIHFQNTGNYPASIVRVEDTLSTLLSLASFQLISSSHPVRLETSGTRTLQFIFDNINLPDSARNEAGSHGFVKFSVRPQPGLVIGDQVYNQAFIYFDFNKAVATNRHVLPVIDPSVAVKEPVALPIQTLMVSPNPGSHAVEISWPQGETDPLQLQITDANGRVVKTLRAISGNRVLLDISSWATGQYWLELKGRNGQLLGTGKLIKT